LTKEASLVEMIQYLISNLGLRGESHKQLFLLLFVPSLETTFTEAPPDPQVMSSGTSFVGSSQTSRAASTGGGGWAEGSWSVRDAVGSYPLLWNITW